MNQPKRPHSRLRSPAEIKFRLVQEATNAWRFCAPPKPSGPPRDRSKRLFPSAEAVAAALRGTAFASQLICNAEQVLKRSFPLLGHDVELENEIRWRRDPVSKIETGRRYYRLLPYLDAERVGDHKTIWELNRHQHLVTLAQAWKISGRREFLDDLARLLESWFQQNRYGCGINWASALEVGFRTLSWIWIDHLAGADLPAATQSRLERGIFQHASHLETNLSIYFSANTHLLGESLALYVAGRYFEALPQGQRWKDLGKLHLDQQLDLQVRADGSHFEQSSYYHVYALDMFLLYAVLSREPDGSLGRQLALKLPPMADYLWALLGPTGEIPYLGDDDGGRLFYSWGNPRTHGRASLALAASLLKKSRWPTRAEDLHPIAVWWCGPSVLATAQPEWIAWDGAYLFPDAGVAVVAEGQDHSVVDTRAFGWARAGHGHAHALSIVHRCGPREFLIDPGTYTYVGDRQLRDQFRGTAVHNTVRVDGVDQATPAGPFAWDDHPETWVKEWDRTRRYLKATVRYRRITHTREIEWLGPGRIKVTDHLEGPPGEHHVEQLWHLAEQEDRHYFQFSSPQENLKMGTGLIASWRSQVFGRKEPGTILIREANGAFPMTLETLMDFGPAR